MRLEEITIVLVRPSEPGNTGAVCRAMKNMGLSRLRIAASELPFGPGSPAELETLLARAVHAGNIWEQAEHFNTLEAALADCTISVGTTRRRGRRRKSNTLSARELAEFLKTRPGRAALVFGNERTGLEGEELERCNLASHIPVGPAFPSINLSHAVQIYAYELYQTLAGQGSAAGGPGSVPGQWVPMARPETDALVHKICGTLAGMGFYRHPGREEQARFLRDLIARAGLNRSEGRYLENIITKAGRLSLSGMP
ncbi:MAG: RNA methyltransferase [Spirochaetaceae bacterium]|jgi:tRNA/rRNA methyltransferase/tRNA (cytidine32/uridine32-2'-O)-methyltransferase|nr:RNA methyltransferase [Spirochaetaceae bacterium]